MLKILSVVSIIFMTRVSTVEIPFFLNIHDLINTSDYIKTIADENLPIESLLVNNSEPPLTEVLQLINNITNRLLKNGVTLSFQIEELQNDLKLDYSMQSQIRKFFSSLNKIDFTYTMFLDQIKRITSFDKKTLKDLVDSLSSMGRSSIQKMLSKMYELIMSPEKNTLWETLEIYGENLNTSTACDMQESYQYLLYRLYAITIMLELEGLTMNLYLFKVYNSSMNVELAEIVDRAQAEFVRRVYENLQEIHKVMGKVSREIYSCDSSVYRPGVDYIELEGLFTTYVLSEYEVYDFHNICENDCENLVSMLHRRCYNNNGEEFCSSHPCYGMIHKCQKIGGRVDLCEENPNSMKRYRYIRSYDENTMYGKWSDCSNGKFGQLDTFWYRNNECNVCMCQCSQTSDASPAIKTFSLRPQISNINKNKVVSDLRFVLKNNLIHIQIKESRLQEYGRTNQYSSWVPLENFKKSSKTEMGGFVIVSNNVTINLTRDVDFTTVSKNVALMNLDEISAGPNYILTGVRLNREKQSKFRFEFNDSPIQLEIHVTPFDFASGQLNPTKDNPSIWLTSKTQPNPSPEYLQTRQENKLGGYVYKYEQENNIPDVKPNRFVRFQRSSVHSDAGQSTIPLLDARPVLNEFNKGDIMGLSGAGIIHRRNEKFAGLLALKILTIDLSNYIDIDISENQLNYYKQMPPLPSKYDELNIQ